MTHTSVLLVVLSKAGISSLFVLAHFLAGATGRGIAKRSGRPWGHDMLLLSIVFFQLMTHSSCRKGCYYIDKPSNEKREMRHLPSDWQDCVV